MTFSGSLGDGEDLSGLYPGTRKKSLRSCLLPEMAQLVIQHCVQNPKELGTARC